MPRIIIATLSAAAALMLADLGPSVAAESLASPAGSTACDCTNCSAEACEPRVGPQLFNFSLDLVSEDKGGGAAQTAVKAAR